jgi:hypothetical protein
MTLEEYRALVEAQRKASTLQAVALLLEKKVNK